MKKWIIAVIAMCSLMGVSAFAMEFKVKCLDDMGKFSRCKFKINDSSVELINKKKTTVIHKKEITKLTMGEYERRRVAEAMLISPLLALSKKKRDQISIEYTQNGTSQVAIVETKKKYGMPIKMKLKIMTGLKFHDGSKKTDWTESSN